MLGRPSGRVLHHRSGSPASAPPQAHLYEERVTQSSPASTMLPAQLTGLALSCTSDCRGAHVPLRRRELASTQTACRWAFLPLCRHAAAHQHAIDHRCSLVCVGCVQGSRLERTEPSSQLVRFLVVEFAHLGSNPRLSTCAHIFLYFSRI
jgi:hypothetical protein